MDGAGQTPHGARPNREGMEWQHFMRACSVRHGERSFGSSESLRISAAGLNARRTPQLSGRSLEPASNDRPRGMTVTAETPYRIRLIGSISLVALRFERIWGPSYFST